MHLIEIKCHLRNVGHFVQREINQHYSINAFIAIFTNIQLKLFDAKGHFINDDQSVP